MSGQRSQGWNRRAFLKGATLAGTAALFGLHRDSLAAEPPPETTRVRLYQKPSICSAPQYLAEEILRAEGFTDVQYPKILGTRDIETALAAGEIDIGFHFAAPNIIRIEAGDPIVMLAGAHVGCFELFGTDRVRAVRDLKGKTVAVIEMGSSQHIFLSTILAYVGLNPTKDINWVVHPGAEAMRLLSAGKIDALLGFPPEPQELREKKIGHVILNSMMDRPWSHYFCCMVTANKGFVEKYPTATKRALHAIMKATDICAREPERVARFLVDKGYTANFKYALQTMKEMAMCYGHWREYDSADTIRFYSLQLHEIGMIKSSPQKIIAQGTDWRFIRELKKELKG
jgi:NitT/TauT family transport system substrate-binding protein